MLNEDFIQLFLEGSKKLQDNVEKLCQLDSALGDGDHGITIGKIAHAIEENVSSYRGQDLKTLFSQMSQDIMNINGGTAGPLWGIMFEGMANAIPIDAHEVTETLFKEMLQSSLVSLQEISNARVGDKTMMDALIPGVNAAVTTEGDLSDILKAAYVAAVNGAKETTGYIAKFGRAKNSKEKCIGHVDPGAVSMAIWFEGLWLATK